MISTEIEDSAKCIGYRAIWRRLVNDHHVRVPRDRVLHIMREHDPEGVRRRKAHMLVRRRYYARGPNYVWHVDGYDKLKPYGFCIRCKVLSRHFEGFWTVLDCFAVTAEQRMQSCLYFKHFLDIKTRTVCLV